MSAINKFSLRNHRLRIETGRYTVPKTLKHVRICSLCQANELESECHVIFFFFFALCMIRFATNFFDEITKKYNFLTISM